VCIADPTGSGLAGNAAFWKHSHVRWGNSPNEALSRNTRLNDDFGFKTCAVVDGASWQGLRPVPFQGPGGRHRHFALDSGPGWLRFRTRNPLGLPLPRTCYVSRFGSHSLLDRPGAGRMLRLASSFTRLLWEAMNARARGDTHAPSFAIGWRDATFGALFDCSFLVSGGNIPVATILVLQALTYFLMPGGWLFPSSTPVCTPSGPWSLRGHGLFLPL